MISTVLELYQTDTKDRREELLNAAHQTATDTCMHTHVQKYMSKDAEQDHYEGNELYLCFFLCSHDFFLLITTDILQLEDFYYFLTFLFHIILWSTASLLDSLSVS